MEWQLIGDDQWVFGLKVRGVVRYRVAEVYFDEEYAGREGGWKWFHGRQYGYETGLRYAIEAAEQAMGILAEPLDYERRRFIADNPTPLHGEQ